MKKDLDWLNNEVEKRIEKIKTDEVSFAGSDYFDEGYIHGMRDVQAIANQLDEPEVLSQEWIDEHITQDDIKGNGYVAADDLQNLLVSEQEEIDRAYKDGYEKGKEHADISKHFNAEFNSVLQSLPISAGQLIEEFRRFVISSGY